MKTAYFGVALLTLLAIGQLSTSSPVEPLAHAARFDLKYRTQTDGYGRFNSKPTVSIEESSAEGHPFATVSVETDALPTPLTETDGPTTPSAEADAPTTPSAEADAPTTPSAETDAPTTNSTTTPST